MNLSYDDFTNYVKKSIDGILQETALNDEELLSGIEDLISVNSSKCKDYLSMKDRIRIADRIYNSIRGFGILDSIMKDDSITEVMINGYDSIYIEKDGRIIKLDDRFDSEESLYDIVQRIVGRAGREVNQANPIVDTRLPDGSRVNVVLPPISLNGATVTIRKFSKIPMTVERLIEYNALDDNIAEILEYLVKAKYNIFICGGTGSGKTTFLNALSNYIPKDERIITIEDSAELQLTGISNLVRLETRNANSVGVGRLTIRDLIKSALRMRPDRIIVGEVRGSEALDLLNACNTGHDGSLSTGHSNSNADMLSRLETMVLTGSEGLPLLAVRQQIASAIDIIIHLSRLRDKSRKVIEISELCGIKDGEIIVNQLYKFVESKDSTACRIKGELKRTDNEFTNYQKLRNAGIDIII